MNQNISQPEYKILVQMVSLHWVQMVSVDSVQMVSLHWVQMVSLHWVKMVSLHWVQMVSVDWVQMVSLHWVQMVSVHWVPCFKKYLVEDSTSLIFSRLDYTKFNCLKEQYHLLAIQQVFITEPRATIYTLVRSVL